MRHVLMQCVCDRCRKQRISSDRTDDPADPLDCNLADGWAYFDDQEYDFFPFFSGKCDECRRVILDYFQSCGRNWQKKFSARFQKPRVINDN